MARDDLSFTIQARSDSPRTGWSPVGGLPPEIKDLLWAQEQAADLLPYQLRGARRPSLGTVYVRQDVGSGLDEAPADQPSTPKLDEHGQLVEAPTAPAIVRVAVRPPSKPMRSALDSDEHLVITGGPGQGKSTLTLRLTAEIVKAWSAGEGTDAPIAEPVLPLRIPARVLAAHLGFSISQTLASSASAEYGRYLSGPLDPALFAHRVEGFRWLLLVDALDEVADTESRAKIVHTLAAWACKDPYRVILTTRPAEGGTLAPLQRAGAVRYELLPFDEEALERFAEHWFGDDDQTRTFLRQIRDAHLSELIAVPLLATIAAIVFEQHGERPLPGNQYQLYESYLEFISSSRTTPETFDRHRTALIEHLGSTRLRSDVLLTTAVRDWAACHPDAGTEDELIEHLTASAPLVPRGGDLAFLHHSFAEHVAATAEARELPADFDPERTAELLHRAKPWEEGRFARAVLLHYTHLHPAQADTLLRHLHDGTSEHHLLAARLLGQHMPASAPVVDDFLTTVRGWAMTTQFRAGLILARASRATHHPGLADWLAGLLEDDEAPWESRAEAATALAVRLRDPRAGGAIAFLRAGLEDTTAPADLRLLAAEALADSASAERVAAERGLRSVLDDQLATGRDRRGAAVVLSAFGGGAREYAVAALQRTLSDVDTRVLDLVDAAVGLAEIGLEFHDRCSEVFLSVLCDRAHSVEGRRQALVGLASLGESQRATETLGRFITDRRILVNLRGNAASALASLGPRQRSVARTLLLAQFPSPVERRTYAVQLSRVCDRDEAVGYLRTLLSDPAQGSSDVIAAANALAGLGPAFHDEAAGHLQRVLTHLDRSRYLFVSGLRELANLTEPHRGGAVARIRAAMADLSVAPLNRCALAGELIECGPEYHAEATHQLLLIADGERDPEVVFSAWNQLSELGPALRDQALPKLLAIARDHGPHAQLANMGTVFSATDAAQRRAAAEVLTALLQDDERSVQTRLQAAQGLLWLGGAFHRTAVDGVVHLVRSGVLLDTPFAARKFAASGPGVRATLAEALHEVLDHVDHTGWYRARLAMEALDVLGHEVPAHFLRRFVDDQAAGLDARAWAAVMLARVDVTCLPLAVNAVFRACGATSWSVWRGLVADLAALGADVRPCLRALMHDHDRQNGESAAAACLLGTSALPVLRKQAEDGYADFKARSLAYQMLVNNVDPSARQEAIDFHLSVLHDANEQVSVRCDAAAALVELDRAFLPAMIEVLWRFAESNQLEVGERTTAAEKLSIMDMPVGPRLARLIIELARDPEQSDASSARLARALSRPFRTEVENFLLADYSMDIRCRVPYRDAWDDVPLRGEAKAAISEVMSAPEATGGDRRKAAAMLLRLSVRIDREAVALLLAQGSTQALMDAAGWGAWEVVHDRALATVRDDALPTRERRTAALLIGAISDEPSVRDFLLADRDAPWRVRVDELWHARAYDELRAIRDNPASLAAQRWRAVSRLADRSLDDRAACATVLAAIAGDPALVPALRWRAAADLAELGERGRAQAKPLLEGMVRSESFGVGGRYRAAAAICARWPAMRPEMLEALRELLPLAMPLQRVKVLYTLGTSRASEAVPQLRALAADTRFSPLVRLRAAMSLIWLRRDQRSCAALVARGVAADLGVPRHVRQMAAGCLAEWSDECREEARALLRSLR